METTLTLEPQVSSTESPSAALALAATESHDSNAADSTEPALTDTTAPFTFLQTGAPELDELLRLHRVARGGAVHLDFSENQRPLPFLLTLCKAALNRGERVLFMAAASVPHLDGDLENNVDLLSGRQLLPEFERGLEALGLAPFINRTEPGDPKAALRYLVASSPEEFENTLDSVLGEDAPTLDMIVVYGLQDLFGHVPQSTWDEMGWAEEVALVKSENERLRRQLATFGERCREAGTTLYLSRGAQPYDSPGATLFLRGLRPLLTTHCGATLFVAHTQYQCVCCECPWLVPGVAAVPVYLYLQSALQGFAFALVQDGKNEDGFDGPLLDEAQLADIPAQMAAFVDALDERKPVGVTVAG